MSLHIAFHEVDALESEIVQSVPIDLNRPVGTGGRSKACEAIGGSIANHRNVQRRAARLIGECDWMQMNIPGCPRDRTERPGVLEIRLEDMNETGRADDAGKQRCVCPPACADVKGYVAGLHEFFRDARREVAFQPLSPEI
jgi:hypothetical protein